MPRVQPDQLSTCADRLRAGELVAFPTETVYGLGADATQAEAIAKVYAVKNRPSFNPLICHVADFAAADKLGVFSDNAQKLAEHFWPGPLTLVVPKRMACPVAPLASAGLESIALRVPAHPVAQALLRAVDRPIVAPSANPSGTLSPSRAEHVVNYFPDLLVLDGGDCSVGVESSIVGCLTEQTYWLRAGGLAKSQIEAHLGSPLHDAPTEKEDQARLAPGRLARHYAPQHQLLLTNDPATPKDAVIVFGTQTDPADRSFNLSPSGSDVEAASRLYALLHEIDQLLPEGGRILVRRFPPQTGGLHEAVLDRLNRAAAPNTAETS